MREIQIDLSSDYYLQQPKVFGGYVGEHNESKLIVKLPNRMIRDDISYYYFEFQTVTGEHITSPNIYINTLSTDNEISIVLWEQLLPAAGNLKFCVNAIELGENSTVTIKGKTSVCTLYISESPTGKDVLIDLNTSKEELQKSIDSALKEAKDSGEFKGDKGDPGDIRNMDLTYSPTSENAQSGKAVAEALSPKADRTEVNQLKEDLDNLNTKINITTDKKISVIKRACTDTKYVQIENSGDISTYYINNNGDIVGGKTTGYHVTAFDISELLEGDIIKLNANGVASVYANAGFYKLNSEDITSAVYVDGISSYDNSVEKDYVVPNGANVFLVSNNGKVSVISPTIVNSCLDDVVDVKKEVQVLSDTFGEKSKNDSEILSKMKHWTDFPYYTELKWEFGKINTSTFDKQASTSEIRTIPFMVDKAVVLSLKQRSDNGAHIYIYSSESVSSTTYIGGAITPANELDVRITEWDKETYGEKVYAVLVVYLDTTKYPGSDYSVDDYVDLYVENVAWRPVEKIMLGKNDISHKSITPDNLYGFTCGKNKLPDYISVIHGDFKIGSRSGKPVYGDSQTDFFYLKPNTAYYHNFDIVVGILCYSDNFVLNSEKYGWGSNQSYTIPEGTCWVKINYQSEDKEHMIYESGESSTYEPYYIIPPQIPDLEAYTQDFIDENEEVINNVLNLESLGKLRFLHVTDSHDGAGGLSVYKKRFFRSMVDVAKRLSCDFILHTGDIVNGEQNTNHEVWEQTLLEVRDILSNSDIPVIITPGNHDYNSSGISAETKDFQLITNKWMNNKLLSTSCEKARDYVFCNGGNGYYYYDIMSKKIRVVAINSMDLTEEESYTIGAQNYHYVSQTQLDWLRDTAFNVSDGWKIICTSHVSCDTGQPNMGINNASALMSLITANNDKIIAYVYGHVHVTVDYDNSGIRFLSTPNAGGSIVNYLQEGRNTSYPDKTARELYRTGSSLFNVCVVNYDNSVTRIRWGVKDNVFGT